MFVPPLRPNHTSDSYMSGEVIIHPSAVLAPGVILVAAPNSKIIIGPGVCVGMGSILQVHEGTLEVEAGANLGSGFLMVGKGRIGSNACIGSATTVFNCSVESGQVVAPGSIVGDTSRRISESIAATEETKQSQIGATFVEEVGEVEKRRSAGTSVPEVGEVGEGKLVTSSSLSSPLSTQDSQESSTEESPNNIGSVIYGQGSIQQLLSTLFPHRKLLSQPLSDEPSE